MPSSPIFVRLFAETPSPEQPSSVPAIAGSDPATLSTGNGPPDDCEDNAVLPVSFVPGQTLAQAVYLSGLFPPPALCSGLARCGRCRMRLLQDPDCPPPPEPVSADTLFFTQDQLSQGWRLACHHKPVSGMRAELPEDIRLFPPSPGLPAQGLPSLSTGERLFLAVDLGTTSLQWRLLSVPASGTGAPDAPALAPRVLWQGSQVNPQMGAGSDVISRLATARTPQGRDRLRRLTLHALQNLAHQALHAGAHGPQSGITALCLAANPAMTCITLGKDTASLAAAPYSLPYGGGQWEKEPGLPPLWTPPQLSPFVGGDIAAGYASLVFDPSRPAPAFPFLLADMGTNGEFLLALSPDRALCASVALGPALEGIGLSCGSEARASAVSDFTLGPGGLMAWALPEEGDEAHPALGDAPLPGVTGTGYIALLYLLLQSRAMDREGRFTPGQSGPLRRFFTPATDEKSHEAFLALPHGLRLRASDVEEALKVKAAFSLGLRRLLDHAGLASRGLTQVFLAGALGRHVHPRALEELGFFPPGMASRLVAVGNASLAGASILVHNEEARGALTWWATRAGGLELASDPSFARDYPDHMRFLW